MPHDTTSAADEPRHTSGRRILYPGNLVGTVHAPGDSEAMKGLLQEMAPGCEIRSIGHYDGSVSLFPAAGFFLYINAHPTDDHWTVHGFIPGGREEVEKAASDVVQMFNSVGIRTDLAYLPDRGTDDEGPSISDRMFQSEG
jgi:hypothetical protein